MVKESNVKREIKEESLESSLNFINNEVNNVDTSEPKVKKSKKEKKEKKDKKQKKVNKESVTDDKSKSLDVEKEKANDQERLKAEALEKAKAEKAKAEKAKADTQALKKAKEQAKAKELKKKEKKAKKNANGKVKETQPNHFSTQENQESEGLVSPKQVPTAFVKHQLVVPDYVPLNLPVKEFFSVRSKLQLSLAPTFSMDIKTGIETYLNTFILKYTSAVDGIVLCYSDLQIPSSTANISLDSGFLDLHFYADLLVWRPKVGSHLMGVVNLISSDHIGLLLHNTFNASIPKINISTEHYYYKEDKKDSGTGCWYFKKDNRPISVNTPIQFMVESMQPEGEVISVVGALPE